MKQSITLPSISNIFSIIDNKDSDNHSVSSSLKLPALSPHCEDHHPAFPVSPISMPSSSPLLSSRTFSDQCSNPAEPLLSPMSPTFRNVSLSPLRGGVGFTKDTRHRPLTHTTGTFSIQPPPQLPTFRSSPPTARNKKKKDPFSPYNIFTPAPHVQIVYSSDDSPILKRRRGRPPIFTEYHQAQGSAADTWTFLTPTVWSVRQTMPTIETSPSSFSSIPISCAMTTFSSTSLESELPMPRKKRGRKPKSYPEGNSCFLWKDIPVVRRKLVKSDSRPK